MSDFEVFLSEYFNDEFVSNVKEAMKYTFLAGGKHIRSQMLLSLLADYGVNPKVGYHAAIALEMIHSYSLIHDDLPAMDNDDMRRGKPSNHKQFGESTAILAGDGLLTEAFHCISEADSDASTIVEMIQILSQYAGYRGMIFGQELDMKANQEKNSIDQVKMIDYFKTGNLFIAALKIAAILANKKEDFRLLEKIGTSIGIAFQIQDDVLEEICSEEQMGKTKSDNENEKVTYLSLLGLERAQQEMNYYYERACFDIKKLDLQTSELNDLITTIKERQK
jgi:Geranylgeranyl pyrophosphate synthase